MGYLPIFLYLFSFIFLFALVVVNNIKNKKSQYRKAADDLVTGLKAYSKSLSGGKGIPPELSDLQDAEQYYLSLRSVSDQSDHINADRLKELGLLLRRTKLQQHWYNDMVTTKPYSFVARLFGHQPI